MASKANRQEYKRGRHQGEMYERLIPQTRQLAQQMRVKVADEQHGLKEEDACRPHRSGPAKQRQYHLSDHGLTTEKKKCAQEECQTE